MEADPAAEVHELRLALTAIVTTLVGRGELRCASVLDAATRFASHSPKQILSSIGVRPASSVPVRFGATRTIDSLCAACGQCPRGGPANPERLMMALPPEPPLR